MRQRRRSPQRRKRKGGRLGGAGRQLKHQGARQGGRSSAVGNGRRSAGGRNVARGGMTRPGRMAGRRAAVLERNLQHVREGRNQAQGIAPGSGGRARLSWRRCCFCAGHRRCFRNVHHGFGLFPGGPRQAGDQNGSFAVGRRGSQALEETRLAKAVKFFRKRPTRGWVSVARGLGKITASYARGDLGKTG